MSICSIGPLLSAILCVWLAAYFHNLGLSEILHSGYVSCFIVLVLETLFAGVISGRSFLLLVLLLGSGNSSRYRVVLSTLLLVMALRVYECLVCKLFMVTFSMQRLPQSQFSVRQFGGRWLETSFLILDQRNCRTGE